MLVLYLYPIGYGEAPEARGRVAGEAQHGRRRNGLATPRARPTARARGERASCRSTLMSFDAVWLERRDSRAVSEGGGVIR